MSVDSAQTMKRLRTIRSHISEADAASSYTRKLCVDVYFGFAKFTSQSTVVVNGKTLELKKAVIATGGYPSIPSIYGLMELHERSIAAKDTTTHPAVMTNETFST